MSDWGAYDPDRFSGLPQSDLAVNTETRKHFALAVCGVLDSYRELREDRNFWAMSVPMRAIFARMPTRYPYYNPAGSPILASNPPAVPVQVLHLPTIHTDNQAGSVQRDVEAPAAHKTASRSSKRDRVRTEKVTVTATSDTADGPSVSSARPFPDDPARTLHPVEMARSPSVTASGSSKGENARSQSVSANGTPEDADSLTDAESESPTDVSSGSVTWARQPSAPKQTFRTHTVQLNSSPVQSRSEKVLIRDSRRKKAERMRRGGSVFGHSTSSDTAGTPSLVKLKEKVEQCKNWRRAFKLALCSLFKYDELKNCTAAHADPKRLQLAAGLVREYSRSRNSRELTGADFHTQYSHFRRSLRPYSHST